MSEGENLVRSKGERSTSDSNNSSTGEKTWGWTFRTLLQPDYTAGQIIGNEKTTGAEAGIESITLKAYPSSRGVEVSLGTGKSFMLVEGELGGKAFSST
ncbi:hypothetical protein LENED_004014 [Lentinula edodes]|uniref:Uncharacterized protein n=1 Tax=Lentinula edodes TaxID=5353 RepID=A0A1Q3E5I4_LENED|nr:hypothetical protein LENED_004014 [Lentinula edodes]